LLIKRAVDECAFAVHASFLVLRRDGPFIPAFAGVREFFDQFAHLRIARARGAVYWIVNLADMQIEAHADPTGPAEQPHYRQKQVYKPVVLDGNELAITKLLLAA
jgi:hypothetical protein